MIQLEGVGKQFAGGRGVTALHEVSLTIERGEMVSMNSRRERPELRGRHRVALVVA